MARKSKQETPETQPNADENHGKGGSYVNGEDGVRTLVERTEDRVPRHVPHEPEGESPDNEAKE